ncbi:dienelactone hydrolase [Clohesyomyces aquaticus]|uniref:Dienelactone hydrolase n=1 Tax=Clohesyomyces aquaticus TaxID=1231657 RepID=A0A1Y1ZM04_9PLEO|nr:dienelactone hydrolase [Clohesyomyces aquaticus]
MPEGVGISSCCLSGKVQDGKPTGSVRTIAGLSTYVAEPTNNSKAQSIVFLVDIFGYTFPNVRLLADSYARAGFTAYIPDVHEGDSLPISFLQDVEPPLPTRESLTLVQKTAATAKVGATLGPWLIKHREAVSKPIIDGFIREIRKTPGTDKVGVIGFCWGGRYAILAAHETDPALAVDTAYACHPSLVAIPADFEGVKRPLSLALGDKDSLLGEKEVGQIKEIMEKKGEVESDVRVYEDQVHGFALRGDWGSDKDKKAMDEAEKQGIEWFKKHLDRSK